MTDRYSRIRFRFQHLVFYKAHKITAAALLNAPRGNSVAHCFGRRLSLVSISSTKSWHSKLASDAPSPHVMQRSWPAKASQLLGAPTGQPQVIWCANLQTVVRKRYGAKLELDASTTPNFKPLEKKQDLIKRSPSGTSDVHTVEGHGMTSYITSRAASKVLNRESHSSCMEPPSTLTFKV